MTDQWVSFSQIGDAEVISLTGEIDLANAAALTKAIAGGIIDGRKILVDLTTVSFLDSAGVRLLDGIVGDTDDRGGEVRLVVGERGAARMTLQLCAFRPELLAIDLERAAAELSH